ncbi:hypothetical protein LTR84_002636 [Exophiala bonariae]|uniref:F-box domain-containing protein n=1 Tax=Exophiala bonariae TaxID=1690606 RepID=A0AAV9NB17_9EURO|nr:hypothetical protein LTR84_002636 [Exophiala bonariae]
MAQFLDLPTEVIDKILSTKYLSRSDIASAILVCKLFSTILVPRLYRQIDFKMSAPNEDDYDWVNGNFISRLSGESGNPEHKSEDATRKLFETLATREDLAHFVTDLRLDSDDRGSWDVSLEESFESKCFGPDRIDPTKVVERLHNLKILDVDYLWASILLWKICLPQLESAIIRMKGYAPVDAIGGLMNLPKLKEITIRNAGRMDDGPPEEGYCSNVSHITLTTPWNGVEYLRFLLEGSKHPKSLKLLRDSVICESTETQGATGRQEYVIVFPNPDSLNLGNILNTVAHSLEVLVLRDLDQWCDARQNVVDIPVLIDRSRIKSLQHFQSLKQLKIGATMVLGTRVCRQLQMLTPYAHDTELYCERLAECMPPKLEVLHLVVTREQLDRDEKYCQKIVQSFVNFRANLPDLKSFVIEEAQPKYQPLCKCTAELACYAAAKPSTPLTDIWEMQRQCLEVDIDLVYISQLQQQNDLPLYIIRRVDSDKTVRSLESEDFWQTLPDWGTIGPDSFLSRCRPYDWIRSGYLRDVD